MGGSLALAIGDTVGDYTVEAILGAGASAVVYRVRSARDGRPYALKALAFQEADLADRLVVEGRLQAELDHPNVVAVLEVLALHDGPALVLEYVSGPSLNELLKHHAPSVEDGLALFGGVLKGVAAAHARAVTHRDLKPANILLDPVDAGFVPRVTDFGLAKVIDPDGKKRRTMSGVSLGTPNYMAPEQFVDAKRVTPAADLFSLGCILYRLTCRGRPWPGTNAIEVATAIGEGNYRDPQVANPDLPDHVARAIRATLEVSPDDRVQTVHALAEMLYGDRPIPGMLAADSQTAAAILRIGREPPTGPSSLRPAGVPGALGWDNPPPRVVPWGAMGCAVALVVATLAAAVVAVGTVLLSSGA